MPGEEYQDRAADALREGGLLPAISALPSGMEPINRYESFLADTCDQAPELKVCIRAPNMSIPLDENSSDWLDVPDSFAIFAAVFVPQLFFVWERYGRDQGVEPWGN